MPNEYVCCVCSGPFDLQREGGMAGDIGILPVAFCPTCYAGVVDMVGQHYGWMDDEAELDSD